MSRRLKTSHRRFLYSCLEKLAVFGENPLLRPGSTGAVVANTDASAHVAQISYTDSFSDGVSRNTLAYPTRLTDPDGYYSTSKYNYDFGALTYRQTPPPNFNGSPASQPPGPEQSFSYDTIGRLQQVTNEVNDAYTRYVYPTSQIRVDTYATIQEGLGEAHSFQFTDGAGRVIGAATQHPGSTGGYSGQFGYDSVGRLSSAREFRGDNSAQSYLVNYEYDLFGNRYQKQAQNGGNPFTQIWVETAHVDQATNRFNTGVTYDNAGNVTVDSKFRNRKFSYDANNRQKQSRNLDDTGAVDSVFDAGGQRVGTQVAGSLTSVLVYDAMGKLLAEYNSTTFQGGTQYIFNDHQNSPRTITSASGTVVARHDYLPFGDDVLNSVGMRTSGQGYGGVEAARQKYAGMETNEATAMSHTLWRQYDALSGRWTAPDPYRGSMSIQSPQSLNRYSYVDNDPINQVDPSGLMPKLPDASTSWSDVADGFWGQGNLIDRPRNIGRLIIMIAMARRDRLVQARIDGKLLVEYLKKRKFEAAKRILNNNEDVGLYQDGKAIWGELAAAFVDGVAGATAEAMVATTDALGGLDLALKILLKAGWKAVANRLSKIRGPDFKVLNVNAVAGITRFIPRGDDMETALQGVSAGGAEGQLSFAVGWILQRETPRREEIINWGSGLSFNVDFFLIGGGGLVYSPSTGKHGVYVGVGVGGGSGGSFQYKVW